MSEQNDSSSLGMKATANLVMWLCQILSVTVEVFLHSGFGERYFGFKALLAVPMILLFALLHQHQNIMPLMVFLWAYIPLAIGWRIWATVRRWLKRPLPHSRYSGRPYLWWLLPRWRETTVKWLEPLLIMALGLAVRHLNQPLGAFVMYAGAGMAISVGLNIALDRNKVMDMNDAILEQTSLAEQHREMQGK